MCPRRIWKGLKKDTVKNDNVPQRTNQQRPSPKVTDRVRALWEKVEGAWLAQSSEKKTEGWSNSNIPLLLKGPYNDDRVKFFLVVAGGAP